MEAKAVLRVNDLHFQYGQSPVLSGLSFEIQRGELCGLFGPNGCGKTTLFKCCLNFLKYRGVIAVNGTPSHALSVAALARQIAYVPQEHRSPFPYNVFEVCLMGRTPHMGSGVFGISRQDRLKTMEALEQMGVADLAVLPYNQLSGGQRQLVLIARALAQETPLIFLDEPTSSLDFHNQVRVWKVLRQITAQGITVMACSHDPNHVAWYCDRVVMLHDHQIIAQGQPLEVFNQQTLDILYQSTCQVATVNGLQVVLPNSIHPL